MLKLNEKITESASVCFIHLVSFYIHDYQYPDSSYPVLPIDVLNTFLQFLVTSQMCCVIHA